MKRLILLASIAVLALQVSCRTADEEVVPNKFGSEHYAKFGQDENEMVILQDLKSTDLKHEDTIRDTDQWRMKYEKN